MPTPWNSQISGATCTADTASLRPCRPELDAAWLRELHIATVLSSSSLISIDLPSFFLFLTGSGLLDNTHQKELEADISQINGQAQT